MGNYRQNPIMGMKGGLYKIGERVFNLHRAIFIREGHRAREAVAIPDSWYTVPLEKGLLQP